MARYFEKKQYPARCSDLCKTATTMCTSARMLSVNREAVAKFQCRCHDLVLQNSRRIWSIATWETNVLVQLDKARFCSPIFAFAAESSHCQSNRRYSRSFHIALWGRSASCTIITTSYLALYWYEFFLQNFVFCDDNIFSKFSCEKKNEIFFIAIWQKELK